MQEGLKDRNIFACQVHFPITIGIDKSRAQAGGSRTQENQSRDFYFRLLKILLLYNKQSLTYDLSSFKGSLAREARGRRMRIKLWRFFAQP